MLYECTLDRFVIYRCETRIDAPRGKRKGLMMRIQHRLVMEIEEPGEQSAAKQVAKKDLLCLPLSLILLKNFAFLVFFPPSNRGPRKQKKMTQVGRCANDFLEQV